MKTIPVEMLSRVSLVLVFCTMIAQGQRVAPGVPPQHYQQLPPQQHVPPQYQQQQQYGQPQFQQQQQIPQHQQPQQQVQHQQQQVQHQQQQPVPQQQQAVPHQQQQVYQQQQHPPQQGHGHGHGHPGQQPVLNPANIQHEREHIAEHMDVPIDTSKMSEQELQFHYFKMHDSDNNNKLDGCELIKSLIHWHEQGSKEGHPNDGKPKVEEKVFSDDELVALIDPILQMDDTSRDGFIDYPEFVKAQKKAAAQPNRPTK